MKQLNYPKILINGSFLCNNITGIERFALELIKYIDKICKKNEIGIVIPGNAKIIPKLININIIYYKKNIKKTKIWEQIIFPSIAFKYKATPLNFANSCSLFYPGISFLMDIYSELFFEDFVTKNEKRDRLYFRFLYRVIAWRAKKILTISNFIKNQITTTFNVNPEKISVIYCSYNHFLEIKSDYSIFNDYPILLEKPFYFSLGSLSKRKNLKWIFNYAQKHPSALFAVSGKSLISFKINELNETIPSNILFLGHLDDGKVKALYEKCKAFIQPSFYEGFGLPPLEALACGAKIIVSNSSCMPEIYSNFAYYIDPYNTNIDLDELLKQPVEPPDELFKKYSIKENGDKLYSILKKEFI